MDEKELEELELVTEQGCFASLNIKDHSKKKVKKVDANGQVYFVEETES